MTSAEEFSHKSPEKMSGVFSLNNHAFTKNKSGDITGMSPLDLIKIYRSFFRRLFETIGINNISQPITSIYHYNQH